MALTSLTAKQMELAKMRIVKILRKYDKGSYIKDMTTYGAIAAINSKMTDSLIPAATGSEDTDIYSPTDSTKPLNKVMSLRDSDPGLFKIVTSKAMMLGHTNKATPSAFDSTGTYDLYTVKTANTNGATAYTKSLQAYVNYQAALALNGATQSEVTYASIKCMIGEGALTGCSLNKWSADQVNSLLTLNALSENYGGSSTFMPVLDGTVTSDFSASAGIPKLVVNSLTSGVGKWYTFDTDYVNIAEAVDSVLTRNGGGRDKFFKIYNSLEYKRAVTAGEFKLYHESIKTIDGLTKLKLVLNDKKILSLVDEGIMSFTDASRDAVTSTDAPQAVAIFDKLGHLSQKHIGSWVEKLPIGSAANAAMTKTSWSQYYNEFWFFAAARDTTFSSLVCGTQGVKKANCVTFAELSNVADVTDATGSTVSGYSFGYGIYGNRETGCATPAACTDATDSYQNFYNKVIKNNNAVAIMKSGVKLPSLCADNGSTDTKKCTVEYKSLAIEQDKTISYAKEYASYWDCVFSKEGAELFASTAANYWESPTALVSDIATALCV